MRRKANIFIKVQVAFYLNRRLETKIIGNRSDQRRKILSLTYLRKNLRFISLQSHLHRYKQIKTNNYFLV